MRTKGRERPLVAIGIVGAGAWFLQQGWSVSYRKEKYALVDKFLTSEMFFSSTQADTGLTQSTQVKNTGEVYDEMV